MRTAILSDIHGNLPAFEALLGELEREPVEQLVCLGDVAAFGPQPREVLERLADLDCPVVMGNTDAWLLDPHPHPERDTDSQRVTEIEMWGAQQLTQADQDFLRRFQPTVELPLGAGLTLLAFHGSPRSNTEIIRATTPDEELAEMFAGHQAALLAGGHTHTPLLRRFQASLLLNPGSVGLPYHQIPGGSEYNPAWAEYAIVEAGDGRLEVALRRVPYELDKLITAVRQSNMPHADWWLADWRSATG